MVGTDSVLCVQIAPEMDGVVVAQTLYSKQFMLHIMKTIDYPALCQTTKEVSARSDRCHDGVCSFVMRAYLVAQLNHPEVPILPDEIPEDLTNADELLQLIHRVIFDVGAWCSLLYSIACISRWLLFICMTRPACRPTLWRARWSATTAAAATRSRMPCPTCCSRRTKCKCHSNKCMVNLRETFRAREVDASKMLRWRADDASPVSVRLSRPFVRGAAATFISTMQHESSGAVAFASRWIFVYECTKMCGRALHVGADQPPPLPSDATIPVRHSSWTPIRVLLVVVHEPL